MRSSQSVHPEASQFVCSLTGTTLHCENPHTNGQLTIAVDDILCALPDSSEDGLGYRVLFLQRPLEETQSNSQRECTHLECIHTSFLPSTILSQYLCVEIPSYLTASFRAQGAKIHVILSFGSGTGSAKGIFDNAVQPFLSFLGLADYEVHETSSSQTITELTRSKFLKLSQIGIPQTIILVSGDGGLADVIDVFYRNKDLETKQFTPPNIAIMPSGTGNAMANSIGLLDRPISALMTLLRGRPVPIPVFCASFSPESQYIVEEGHSRIPPNVGCSAKNQPPRIYGAIVASWGMHAALVADSDTAEYRKFGADRFKMAAKELLYPSSGTETHKYNGVVTFTMIDRKTGKRCTEVIKQNQHMYVLATLVSHLEKDFRISPDSKPLDGRMRVIRFGPLPPDQAMHLMALAYQSGKHVHEQAVTYVEVEHVRIEFQEEDERWRRVCVDGKIIAVQQGGWMEVCKETKHLLNLITCTP